MGLAKVMVILLHMTEDQIGYLPPQLGLESRSQLLNRMFVVVPGTVYDSWRKIEFVGTTERVSIHNTASVVIL